MEQILFDGMEIELRRSKRKSLGLEVRPDGSVILRVPNQLPEREARLFLEEKRAWLRRCIAEVLRREAVIKSADIEPLSEAELSELTKAARAYFTAKCEELAPLVGVDYGRITIRHQKTRWGSCSSKGNLNFNCLLMLAPEEVRDYIVVHELCHRKQLNHSKAFWSEVARVLPDYPESEEWLRRNGTLLLRRLEKGGLF